MPILYEGFWVAVLFQVKHFLADYPFQTPYMLQKFKKQGWILPLAAHAGVHAGFTILISIWMKPTLAFPLALFDFVTHFVMDRIKASPDLLGRYKVLSSAEYPSATPEARRANTYFWWAMGFDQMVHQLSYLVIIFFLLR